VNLKHRKLCTDKHFFRELNFRLISFNVFSKQVGQPQDGKFVAYFQVSFWDLTNAPDFLINRREGNFSRILNFSSKSLFLTSRNWVEKFFENQEPWSKRRRNLLLNRSEIPRKIWDNVGDNSKFPSKSPESEELKTCGFQIKLFSESCRHDQMKQTEF